MKVELVYQILFLGQDKGPTNTGIRLTPQVATGLTVALIPLRKREYQLPLSLCHHSATSLISQIHHIMPSMKFQSLLIAGACLASTASAQIDPQLVGTWSTKSSKVITGPVRTILGEKGTD